MSRYGPHYHTHRTTTPIHLPTCRRDRAHWAVWFQLRASFRLNCPGTTRTHPDWYRQTNSAAHHAPSGHSLTWYRNTHHTSRMRLCFHRAQRIPILPPSAAGTLSSACHKTEQYPCQRLHACISLNSGNSYSTHSRIPSSFAG